MKKAVMLILAVSCLLLVGCTSIGNALASTKNVCCCRVTPLPRADLPYHVFQHFSMCIPPDYEVATDMDAPPSVNSNPGLCE
ncbi:MAG: hypothetical protein QW666_03620, partial [Candidatus Woesearchaeota archaeon]